MYWYFKDGDDEFMDGGWFSGFICNRCHRANRKTIFGIGYLSKNWCCYYCGGTEYTLIALCQVYKKAYPHVERWDILNQVFSPSPFCKKFIGYKAQDKDGNPFPLRNGGIGDDFDMNMCLADDWDETIARNRIGKRV